jgi:tetratricopeptide (TPR) repeat protein
LSDSALSSTGVLARTTPLGLLMAATRALLLVFVVCAADGGLRAQDANTSSDDHLRRGGEALAGGDLETAANEFAIVVAQRPAFAEAHFDLGLAHEQQGKMQDAIADFQSALRLKPTLRGANLFLGICYYKTNDFSHAKTAIEREIKLNPSDAKALMWLGIVDLGDGQPEAAVVPLDKAAALAPKDPDILYHRGRAHLFVSQRSYQEMYDIDPQSWRVHQVLAQAYAESERYMDAIAEYQRAIQLAPGEPSLNEGLGDAYRMSTQLEKAEQAYARELELDPHNPVAMSTLGRIRVERGNAEGAIPVLQGAIKENPKFFESHYYLGRALAETGQSVAAEEQFKLVIRGAPESDLAQRTYFQLARLYRVMKRPDDAAQALRDFQRLKAAADAHAADNLEERKKAHAQPEPETNPQ